MSKKIIKANTLVLVFAILGSCGFNKEETNQNGCRDSLNYFMKAFEVANYFSIEANENAQKSFLEADVDVSFAMQKINFDLNQLNKSSENHPLLPKPLFNNEKVYMNKAAVLNNQWIILDYYKKDENKQVIEVGEVLVRYTFKPNQPCEFHVLDTNIY